MACDVSVKLINVPASAPIYVSNEIIIEKEVPVNDAAAMGVFTTGQLNYFRDRNCKCKL